MVTLRNPPGSFRKLEMSPSAPAMRQQDKMPYVADFAPHIVDAPRDRSG